jgi:two-component system, OmpR family, response regulator ChvI
MTATTTATRRCKAGVWESVVGPWQNSCVGETDVVRVLFVEDDNDFREALADQLSDLGFAVQGFVDSEALLGALDSAIDADVIVLDWSLPNTSGIDLLTELRRRGVSLPVVFLTGHTLTRHESLAFDNGAVDFIDKTRGVDVLVRRLKRVVEDARPAADLQLDKRMVFGKLDLRPNISRAYWNEADVGLTVGEYNIVHLLASNAGRHVTYRAIYDRMHYEGFIAGHGKHGYRSNVRSSIKRIRKKFLKLDPTFAEIANYKSFGYCWGKPEAAE